MKIFGYVTHAAIKNNFKAVSLLVFILLIGVIFPSAAIAQDRSFTVFLNATTNGSGGPPPGAKFDLFTIKDSVKTIQLPGQLFSNDPSWGSPAKQGYGTTGVTFSLEARQVPGYKTPPPKTWYWDSETLYDHDDALRTFTVNYVTETSPFTISFRAGGGGSLTGDTQQSIATGNNGTAVTAVADDLYNFKNWTNFDGTEVSTSETLTVQNVVRAEAYKANFARKSGTLIVELFGGVGQYFVPGYGWHTTTKTFQVATGEYTITFIGQENYILSVTADAPFTDTFPSVGSIEEGEVKTITATYTIITYTISGTVTDGTDPMGGVLMTMSGGKSGTMTTAADGQYSFLADIRSSVSIIPSKTGYIFDPGLRNINNIYGDNLNKNFTGTRDMDRLIVNISSSSSNGSYDISGPTGIGQQSEFANINGRTTDFNSLVPTGDYTVTFTSENGYSREITATAFTVGGNSASGTIVKGQTETISGNYTLKTGTLSVNAATNPNHGPTNSSAGWTIKKITTVSGVAFADRDGVATETVSNLPLGEYQVVFKDVSGWQTPATETVTVQAKASAPASSTDGNDASVTGTYTMLTGSLTVNVATDPNYNPTNNSATWTVSANSTVSGVSFSDVSGNGTVTLDDIPLGSYKVKFDELTGWDKPTNKTVEVQEALPTSAPSSVTDGNDASVTGTYSLIVGSLTVSIKSDPNYAALKSSATWTVSQTSSISGVSFSTTTGTGTETIVDAPLGEYEVVFDDASGWQTPANETVNIEESPSSAPSVGPASASSGIEASATGTYVLKVGTLTVNIASDPDWDDTNDGATWTVSATSTITGIAFTAVTGTGTDSISDVPLGEYEVVYDDLTGWVTPATDTVTVEENVPAPADSSNGNAASTTGTYSLEMGELTVSITTSLPDPAIPGSAAWSLSGTTLGGPSYSTSDNGSSTPTLPTGDYTISYGDFTNWDAPADDPFTLATTGETVIGHYLRHLGSVQVTIIPDAAIAGGAGWRPNPNVGWRASGTTASGIPTGIIYIQFNDTSDYFTPGSVRVNVTKDTTQTVIVSYNKDLTGTGNLQINIDGVNGDNTGSAPAGATDQPQWRFTDTDTWYDSGTIIANIANGDYHIEFSVLQGYVPPSQSSVNVRPGIENNVSAQYLRPLIVHRSDYDGDGSEDLAIHDAATRTWSIASSGNNKTSTSAKLILEKKFGTKESIPTPGDYDGDGYADLAYYLQAKGEWKVNKQFKLKGFGQAGDIPVPGDYNGDGRTDPALYRPSTGEWLIHDLDRDKTMMVSFGSSTEIPVPGNYDGDASGMTDLAVYDVVTAKWRVAIYNAKKNKWVNKKKLGATFGSIGEMPVQADYDGDGKTDIAVYNRELSLWKVMGQFELELGIEGDVPVPNDWAGLGRAIPAIFRAKTGAWIALDNLLNTRFGAGGQPLMSGR